jgi:excisionase family DNA binding protein
MCDRRVIGEEVPMIREKIIEMKETGLTLKEIGRKFDISAERVRQIFSGKSNRKEQPTDFDLPLSTGDVARLLNVHTNTVRRWSRSGILKTYRVGPRGDRRFKREDVQRLFQEPS